jgi:hypothetical protein
VSAAREALAEHLYFAQVAPKSIEALLDAYRVEVMTEAAGIARRAADHYRATAQPDRARVTAALADRIQKAGGGS